VSGRVLARCRKCLRKWRVATGRRWTTQDGVRKQVRLRLREIPSACCNARMDRVLHHVESEPEHIRP
jgi:hypothetical protein